MDLPSTVLDEADRLVEDLLIYPSESVRRCMSLAVYFMAAARNYAASFLLDNFTRFSPTVIATCFAYKASASETSSA